MVSIVLELLSDKNPNIKGLVNAILDYVQLHDDMWKQEIKKRRFEVHNQVFLEIMDEYDKAYPIEPTEEDMLYYEQMQQAAAAEGPHFAHEMEGMDPRQRAAYIEQYRAMLAANGQVNGEEFDSDEDALFFDNNDLANRIWEDNELEQDG